MVWSLTLRVMTGTGRSVRSVLVIDLLTYTVSIPGAFLIRSVAIILVVAPMADGEAWFGRILFWVPLSTVSITTVPVNVIGFF